MDHFLEGFISFSSVSSQQTPTPIAGDKMELDVADDIAVAVGSTRVRFAKAAILTA